MPLFGLESLQPYSPDTTIIQYRDGKSRKITVPDYPPLILYYWKQKYYEMGVITKEIGGYTVKIYDMEKSVCDAVKYRTKIGIETASERLNTKL